jgi:hypothetical protein
MADFATAFPSWSVLMRSVVTDVAGRMAHDEYDLTFEYDCWNDELSIAKADDLGDQTYTLAVVTSGKAYKELPLPVVT